jgi:hypothetical protein
VKQTKRDRADLGRSIQGAAPWKSALAAGNKPFSRKRHSGHFQVDANHDGLMDNRDLTSVNNPMPAWINNDYDRGHTVDGSDWEQDDLNPGEDGFPSDSVADCYFNDPTGPPAIPSQRDLEDYFRLWMPGYSNMIANLPTNYGVNLQWRNNTGAGIRVFRAEETNGGTNYLFDTNTAAAQTNFSVNPCYGYVSANQPLDLATEYRTWILAPPPNCDHFIFCGTSSGNDELVLQITNQYGGEVGEASVFLNLKDIKQMYERWTVGDDPTVAPNNIAVPAYDSLPPGASSFQYPYDSQTDINTPYILHVHGSNMEPWDKDRFAETMYKRLYWQGYTGRFGSFRWPTSWGFTGSLTDLAFDRAHFDLIEYTAWQSALGLKNMLTRLNILYPGQVQVTAHSMGNITAGEALRQATSTLVNFYGAFQGAGAAHCYDTNAQVIPINIAFNAGESNVYAHYWTPTNNQYFAGAIGAASYVNFFNTNDAVLNYWLTGQKFKPDGTVGYSYSTSSGYFYTIPTPPQQLLFPGDTYKIFAFCQQAECNCIGEQTNLGGQFRTPFQIDLAGPPYNYQDTHKYHSAEFRSDNMSRAVFWNQLLVQMGLK